MEEGSMAVVHIEAEIPWRIGRADGEHWVGICDPLELTVESETWADLMEDIALTLDAMLHDLLSNNELDQFLQDRGWTAHGPTDGAEAVRFDVPFIPALVQPDDSTAAFHR